MTTHSNLDAMYERLMVTSREAFSNRQYAVAYHLLAAAMHCAEDAGNSAALTAVEQLAREQMVWIDTHDPMHQLSRPSAAARGSRSVYDSLLVHLASIRTRLQREHKQM